MPLHDAIQLIVQVEQGDGSFSCETRTDLLLARPVYLAFCHDGTALGARQMEDLVRSLRAELDGVAGAKPAPARNGGTTGPINPTALNDPNICKLLVAVGGGTASLASPVLAGWGTDPNLPILPVFPRTAKPRLAALLPQGVREQNAALWDSDVEEAVPAVLAAAGMTAEHPKIFISYRQVDSARLAIQLFDALSHAGFDVFLDHFRIPPGVNFQARLTQELGDKSMILVIESARLCESPWVLYEINVAKAAGLGICALNLAGAPAIAGIDEGVRERLAAADFEGEAVDRPLTDAGLARVTARIRAEHDRSILRRRRALERSFEDGVRIAGGPPVVREPTGAYRVSTPARTYLTWLTTRPPDLPDFHYVHGAAQQPTIGVIIGLSRLMEPPRARRGDWLAGLCGLRLIDEGRLVWAAGEIARGTL